MAKPCVAVLVFPGTNCNIETKRAVELVGLEAEYVWHEEKNLNKFSAFIIPGGFSYGDYLRAGKLASLSPVVDSLIKFIQKGYPVLGICNGFQILCELGVLPGALIMNANTKFISRWVELEVENIDTPFTCTFKEGEKIKLPIAHKFGNYFPQKGKEPKVIFRYCENPNGSFDSIAGISSGNVVGLMPHPERAVYKFLGSDDGLKIFLSLRTWLKS
jgi:phosphoribosylformylglycinamidine synthase